MSSPANSIVYKLLGAGEWREAERTGRYLGSADDARDGFIHFSAADQLAGTAAKYFRRKPDLVLVAIAADRLGEALKWEPSRGGALFPHLYGPLDVTAAVRIWPLTLGPDGVPVLPKDLD